MQCTNLLVEVVFSIFCNKIFFFVDVVAAAVYCMFWPCM